MNEHIRILCFVNARMAAGDDIENWLYGIKWQSCLEIPDRRLRAMHRQCSFLLALHREDRKLVEEAERLGRACR